MSVVDAGDMADVGSPASAENPFAGQGAVVLDIGGDIGALVVTMPESMLGEEVEIRAVGDTGASHHQGGGHGDGHSHGPGQDHHHDHEGHHYLHVAVVARPAAGGATVTSLVFPELVEGDHELYVKGTDQVDLVVTITGGEVTDAVWPS